MYPLDTATFSRTFEQRIQVMLYIYVEWNPPRTETAVRNERKISDDNAKKRLEEKQTETTLEAGQETWH